MLNLSKIELRGFKSFADKVEIPFQEGVTAIIGPNGCGKSNVSDAIRWTLGEASAKQLRGKSMQDVIFAGTEKRKSMSYCEVSLFFKNENSHIFPGLPYDEVVITRKLDRSGLSEYYLNRTRCRLKDIIALLRDTGIGKEGYSIIGQGRVDEVMSAKPDDRRHIFEEAAGISKFRAQRKEAESKLEKTQMNLQTANEIITEIERQINPLRKQAETAQKYFELKEQLKQNEVNLYIYNFENNQAIKQKIYDKLAVIEKDLKLKEMQYNECSKQYEACLREQSGIDRLYEELNNEFTTLKVDEAKFEGNANVIKERLEKFQSERNRLNGDLEAVDEKLTQTVKQIEQAEQRKEEELASYLKSNKEFEALQSKYSFLSKSIDGQESDLERKNQEYVQAIEDLSALKTNLAGYVTEKGINEARAQNLSDLLEQKSARLSEERTNLAIYEGKLETSRTKMRELTTEYNENLQNKLEAQEAVKAYAEDVVSLNAKLGSAEGNLKLLTSIKNEYTGYQEAVKRLMQDAKDNTYLSSRIWGVVAEVIDVPSEYEAAIEYALGGNMQNVLVESERDASDLITYLKQKNYGRVTFRPLTACRARTIAPEFRSVLDEPGCFGIASDLVRYEKKFEKFVQTLLGTTVVVNNIDNAIRISKKYDNAFKIVTLDGEIFARGGEITGGSRRSQTQGLLSQEKQIEQAKINLERIKKNIATLNAQRLEREQEVAEYDENVQRLSHEISELRIEISLNDDKATAARQIVEALTVEVEGGRKEYETIVASIEELAQKIGSIDELEKIANSKRDEFDMLRSTSKSKSNEQKDEYRVMGEQVMQMRVQLATHRSQLDALDGEIFRLNNERAQLETDKLDLIAQLKVVQEDLDNISKAPEKTVFSKEDAARIEYLKSEIDKLSTRKRTITDELVSLNQKREQLTGERNQLNESKIRSENMLENVDIEMRNQQQHILEEYDLTYASALEYKNEEFKAYGAQTVITELKRAIGRLGDVNPLALETLKETEARLEEQTKQRDDIQKAYDDILTIINELTGEMQEKFSVAFAQINENFKVVFEQLFGGGKGELRLDTKETEDVLEAGIEIFAQPPGKKLQNISLLSGGERALTAISILFAILKLKPMPFCVLDEIEAALDDANVNLFAEFLKKFSDFTQFIVITHRKPTMRHADTIFGVTMEEKGVTKIVSIEFEDAEKQVR